MSSLPHRLARLALSSLAAVAPLLLAAVLALVLVRPYVSDRPAEFPLQPLAVAGAAQLEAVFDGYRYAWPPADPVPPLAIDRFPPDINALPMTRKKALFFRALLPLVEAENARIRDQRRYVEARFAPGPLRPGTRNWNRVARLAELYRVRGDLNDAGVRQILLKRMDEVPAALALAQAANESAWGTSRFAREANNLFGLWTYDKTQGLAPLQRKPGTRHYVRRFADLRSSVRTYLHTLNVGRAYVELRGLRAEMRAADEALDPLRLAGGLRRYSERGMAYVQEIRAVIRLNALEQLGGPGLQAEVVAEETLADKSLWLLNAWDKAPY